MTDRELIRQMRDALAGCFNNEAPSIRAAIAAADAVLAQPEPGTEQYVEIYDTFGNSQDPTKCVGHVWLAPGYFPGRGTRLYSRHSSTVTLPPLPSGYATAWGHVGLGGSLVEVRGISEKKVIAWREQIVAALRRAGVEVKT